MVRQMEILLEDVADQLLIVYVLLKLQSEKLLRMISLYERLILNER